MRCGNCGSLRAEGEVCCAAQAANQGRLHATCNHPAPDMPADWLAIYLSAAEEEIESLSAH